MHFLYFSLQSLVKDVKYFFKRIGICFSFLFSVVIEMVFIFELKSTFCLFFFSLLLTYLLSMLVDNKRIPIRPILFGEYILAIWHPFLCHFFLAVYFCPDDTHLRFATVFGAYSMDHHLILSGYQHVFILLPTNQWVLFP